MNKLLIPFCTVLSFLFLSLSCQKELKLSVPEVEVVQTVTATIKGRIVDEKQTPVNGAAVITLSRTTITDINGEFTLSDVQLDKDLGFIKVEKAGYFPGSRTIVINEGVENYAEIELIPKKVIGNFSATAGGTISIPSGGSINFATNAIVNATTGTPYTGNVSVSAFHLNPSAENFDETMPGALRGITTNNQQVALQSFGMMAVELMGDNGEKLQLTTGQTATINFPITPELLSQAPQTIPLWYFDEVKGVWKEEGSATKQGNSYIGTVGHFSFWNCDAPFPVIDFEAELKDMNDNPLEHAKVVITMTNNKLLVSSTGFSDHNGKICGKVPADKSLTIEVYSKCGDVIYSKEIGPFTNKTNLGTIKVATGIINTTITGTVKDCNNAAVTNGFVDVIYNGSHYRASIINGNYTATLVSCVSGSFTAELTAFDLANNKISDIESITVNPPTPVSTPLIICNATIDQFVNYTVNGDDYSFVAPADSIRYTTQGAADILYAINKTFTGNKVSMSFQKVTSTGTFTVNGLGINARDTSFFNKTVSALNITEYNTTATGTYISGNLTATVGVDSTTINYPATISFRVKK